MAATIVHSCPRCRAKNQNFDIVGVGRVFGGLSPSTFGDGQPLRAEIAVICRSCELVSGLLISTTIYRGKQALREAIANLHSITNDVGVISVSPTEEGPEKIEFLPDAVQRSFLQGEESRLLKNNDAAGAMYRKALDVATKERLRSLSLSEDGTLFQRIGRLGNCSQRPLTPDMVEWAHIVREDGNLATHDEREPTDEEIEELGNFTRLLLIYLYELPGKVARNKVTASSSTTP